MRLWLPALLVVPLACDRPEESAEAQAQTQALRAATEELAAARAALEADRSALAEELAAVRKAVDAANAKLDAMAAEQGRAVPAAPPDLVDPFRIPTDPEVPRVVEDPAALAAAVRCESETRCTVEQTYLETLIVNPGGLAKQARIVPRTVDGTLDGYKLYGIRPGSLFKALGVKNGDLVRSINGMALGSMDQTLEAFAKLRHEKTYTLEMERKGAPFTLTVDVVGAP